MDLDDQLAALAAGDLDEATARDLRARVAADPALARRLARLERLDEVLTGWEAPGLDEAATRRLTERIDGALAELGDEPLRTERPVAPGPAPLRGDDGDATGGGRRDGAPEDRAVVDLGAERARRRGVPAWATGAAVAAVLTAIVGIGTGTVLTGSGDEAADVVADAPAESEASGGATGSAMTESDTADDGARAESAPADTAATFAAPVLVGVELAEGELARLALEDPDDLGARRTELNAFTADSTASGEADDAGSADGDAAEEDLEAAEDPTAACTTVALERDTDPSTQVMVELVATGTYAGQDAVMVVLREPGAARDTLRVLAYAVEDCTLLDTTTVRQ